MAGNHLKYFPQFVVMWIAFGICVTIALSRVRAPARKLRLVRASTVVVGLLFLGAVWFVSGSSHQAMLGVVPVSLIIALTSLLVKVCPHCAATVRPYYFRPPAYCPHCGAKMDPHSETH